MPINVKNFINSLNLKSKNSDFQDLEHLDGVSISTVCANLYSKPRDDLVMFYFRDGANYASVYTQSKIVSENIKWNLNIKSKKIKSLIVNTRSANAFTGFDHSDANSRRIFNMMIGPGVDSNLTIGNENNQIGDIVNITPTIAEILGFKNEMMSAGLTASNNSLFDLI